MIIYSTEFEMMRSLYTLYVKELITFEQVEELLLASYQLELVFLNKESFKVQSLDGKTKYEL